jgi:hypothetical protein
LYTGRELLLAAAVASLRVAWIFSTDRLGLLCLSTVKLDLVRPGFRSLPKTTDADADKPQAPDHFRHWFDPPNGG